MAELETQAEQSRKQIAVYLRDLADQLETEGEVCLDLGGQDLVLNPTDPVTFKVEGESDWTEGDQEAKQSVELELVWWQEVTSPEEGRLTLE